MLCPPSGPAVCLKMWISVEVCREGETDEECAGGLTLWRFDGGWGRWRLLFRRLWWFCWTDSSVALFLFMCILAAVHLQEGRRGWVEVGSTMDLPVVNPPLIFHLHLRCDTQLSNSLHIVPVWTSGRRVSTVWFKHVVSSASHQQSQYRVFCGI